MAIVGTIYLAGMIATTVTVLYTTLAATSALRGEVTLQWDWSVFLWLFWYSAAWPYTIPRDFIREWSRS